jgi:hypothetical protein
MNLKVLLTIFFIVLTISGLAYALDFSNIKNIIFHGKSVDFQSFTPFDGTGSPSKSPDWFTLANYSQKKSSANGFITQNKDGTFDQKITMTLNGNLNVKGSIKPVEIRFWSEPSVTTCKTFTQQKVLCFSSKGHIKITRQSYRWTADVKNYSFELTDQGKGFTDVIVTGYDGEKELFKFDVQLDYLKFNFYPTPRKVLTFQATGGVIDFINPPANANPNIPFNMSKFTDIRNYSYGTIVYNGGFTGSVELSIIGVYNANHKFDKEIDKDLLRFDIPGILERTFSDCGPFNSTDVYCKIRFGYIHAYKPTHEDQTLWKTFFDQMILNITKGKLTISVGFTNGTEMFRISDMNVTKLQLK